MTDTPPASGHKPKKATRKGAAAEKPAGRKAAASSAASAASSANAAAAHSQHAPPASPLFGDHHQTPSTLAHVPRFLHPVHRCRFPTFLPSSIISLAFSPSSTRLAIGRANGNIELWAVALNAPGQSATSANGWVLVKTIPGSGEATVQVLKWTRGINGRPSSERLFSAGLNGRLIEWDLQALAPKYASDTYGGAVWCGAVYQSAEVTDAEGNTVMALGCEDGTIRLFDLSDASQSPIYIKAISRHNSRILSIAYSPDGAHLVTGGSDGLLKLWDVSEGRNIQRITVENKGLKRTTTANAGAKKTKTKGSSPDEAYVTLIWSVQFLSAGTVMSGDSLGNIQIWDLEFGTLKQSFPKALHGDVLSLVVNATRTVAYAAGVEGKIVELKAISGEEEQSSEDHKWVLTANHRHHTHDVYALALSPATLPVPPIKSTGFVTASNNYLLVSGGVDTQLLLSPTVCFPEYSSISRLLPFPQNKTGVCVADKVSPPRFLVTHDQHLQLYGLGSMDYESTTDKLRTKELHVKENDLVKVEKGYTHLLDINVNSRKSIDTSDPSASVWVPGGGLNLVCSSLSPDASYIACSDPIQVKLYNVKAKEGSSNPNNLVITKVQDSTKLFVATLAGPVQILDLATLEVQVLEEHVPEAVYEGDLSSDDDEDMGVSTSKKASAQLGLLRTIAVSHDQQYLTIGDELNHIWVYNLDSMRLHATLPTFAQAHLTMEFHPHNSTLLAVLCARNTLYFYDVERQQLTDYSKQNLMSLVNGSNSTSVALAADQFTHLSFDRSALTNSNSLILQSINHLLHINLDKPKPKEGIARAHTQSTNAQSGGPLNRRDRKRKLADEAAGVTSDPEPTDAGVTDPLQVNFRLINRFRPMLFGGFVDESDESAAAKNAEQLKAAAKKRKKAAGDDASTSQEDASIDPEVDRPVVVGSSLLVIEAPWLNILQQLPQPVARHRYGS